MFSEAMSEIDSRYVEKTLNYHNKKKKYILSLAASLVFILSLALLITLILIDLHSPLERLEVNNR